MPFAALFILLAGLAGAVASVAGFGIGSLMTPPLSVELGAKVAVALVSIPHFAATLARFWMLREHLDRRVLGGFGLMSAAGGLAGAVLQERLHGPALAAVLGALLVFAGLLGLSGLGAKLRFSGPWAWLAGAASGVFGGLVGNQGGIRSAAMLGLDVPRQAFVATATAIALMVDLARMPVYLYTSGRALLPHGPLIAAATAAALAGTFLGRRLLERIPEPVFRRLVAAVILLLGVWLLARSA